jgi:hypothetical protein
MGVAIAQAKYGVTLPFSGSSRSALAPAQFLEVGTEATFYAELNARHM